jgi:hypothetical protein
MHTIRHIGRPSRGLTRMKTQIVVALCTVAAATTARVATAVAHPATTFCASTTTHTAMYFLDRMQSYAADTAASAVAFRSAMGMPSATKASVVPVSDETKCSRASRAIDSAVYNPPRAAKVILVQVGTDYMAQPLVQDAVIVHLDNLFTVRGKAVQQ